MLRRAPTRGGWPVWLVNRAQAARSAAYAGGAPPHVLAVSGLGHLRLPGQRAGRGGLLPVAGAVTIGSAAEPLGARPPVGVRLGHLLGLTWAGGGGRLGRRILARRRPD